LLAVNHGVQWSHPDEEGSNFLLYDGHVETRMWEDVSSSNFRSWY